MRCGPGVAMFKHLTNGSRGHQASCVSYVHCTQSVPTLECASNNRPLRDAQPTLAAEGYKDMAYRCGSGAWEKGVFALSPESYKRLKTAA